MAKGVQLERDYVTECINNGIPAIRGAGSGSGTGIPKPDVLHFTESGVIWVIQAKSANEKTVKGEWVYYPKDDFYNEWKFRDLLETKGYNAEVYCLFHVSVKGRPKKGVERLKLVCMEEHRENTIAFTFARDIGIEYRFI